ncbi:MAG: hypothetical protein ACPGIA_09690 [Luteolibacter sp.]
MNIIPTVEGGLRVDLEEATDWLLLRHLIDDACQRELSLAEELGQQIDEDDLREDWMEYIVPDLQSEFATSLEKVREVMAKAVEDYKEGDSESGSLWITRELGYDWYSSFNQARMAIEARYGFGDAPKEEILENGDPSKRSAYYRSQFYGAVQGLLLEHVLE